MVIPILPHPCAPCTRRRPTARLPRHGHQPGPAEAGTPGAATLLVTTGTGRLQAEEHMTVDHRSRPVSSLTVPILSRRQALTPQGVMDHPIAVRIAADPRRTHIDHLDQQVTEHPVGVRYAGLRVPSTAS